MTMNMILAINMEMIGLSIAIFLGIILVLVILLLVAKNYLSPSGPVKVTLNGEKEIEVASGGSLLGSLSAEGVFLPSACGGKGSCGQCRCQVPEGGGEILPTETVHFSRKQIKDNWRLGCQVKVKNNMSVTVPESVLGVKEWECEVISNRNVATFIKEFKVKLPAGEHMDFVPGSYAQIVIPEYDINYADFDRSLIGDLYVPAWENFGLFNLKQKNTEQTIRAYSMANYPDEGDIITLTVRIATPPFKPKDQGPGFMDVPCGIASTYIFSLKPGDKVIMSGPYGDFHPEFDSKREMIWVGGGAGMAPLRAQIMHMLKTLNTRDREMHYFYGARAIDEVFFLEDFLELEKEFPNFHFHLALDRPDPKADKLGVKYTAGFIAPVMGDTYLKQHEEPEEIEYYLCGPPMMAKTVLDLLDSLGVEKDMIHFDDFGG
ncbi:MAG: NADH:ubiquinone reductase (Na(+)-transporting) subunit F [Paludibacteraceae bacterium]|nr:NADH:ubiquinone reductase (Na(+)-transporting) subunit F [Paludibacteraceae bacterium]MBR3871498.1 NADH:ubiquinone reductase (Na(+)-transporting) subunit F [Paludibacteraceae bacterium]MBR6686420.1 NADH:ubiquinone reductase (Na(+)-transporting) subunit F [Paludibacteraceae bacterium]